MISSRVLRQRKDARIAELETALRELLEHHEDYCVDPHREAPGEFACPEATDKARAALENLNKAEPK